MTAYLFSRHYTSVAVAGEGEAGVAVELWQGVGRAQH